VTAQRLKELELLYEVGLRLMNSLEQDYVILQVGLTALQMLPEAQHCIVCFLSDDDQVLSSAVLVDRGGSVETYPGLDVEDTVWQTILRKEAVYVAEIGSDASCGDSPLREQHSLALSPLIVDERCIGAIGADSTSADAFDLAQRRLLSILANQAAAAIMKARLIEELNLSPCEGAGWGG